MKPKIRRLLFKDYLDQRGSMNNKMILLSTILIQTQEPYRLHPLKRDLNYEKSRYTIRQQEITFANHRDESFVKSHYPLGIVLRVARAAPPRTRFHNKGGVLSLNILGCIIHLEERCARAQLSTLRSAGKEAEKGGKLGIADEGLLRRIEFWFGHAPTFSSFRSPRVEDPRWRCTCHARASNSSKRPYERCDCTSSFFPPRWSTRCNF